MSKKIKNTIPNENLEIIRELNISKINNTKDFYEKKHKLLMNTVIDFDRCTLEIFNKLDIFLDFFVDDAGFNKMLNETSHKEFTENINTLINYFTYLALEDICYLEKLLRICIKNNDLYNTIVLFKKINEKGFEQ